MDTRGQGLDKARKVLMCCGTLRRTCAGGPCTHVRHKFLEDNRQEQTPAPANPRDHDARGYQLRDGSRRRGSGEKDAQPDHNHGGVGGMM
jgi:hypothetical protein